MGGACSTNGRDLKRIHFIGKSERRRPFGGPKRKKEDNVNMYLEKM
jgi:hypothetical protein